MSTGATAVAKSDLLVDLHRDHVAAVTAALSGAAVSLLTGFARLDVLTGGFYGTVAIASPPGGGKTSFAVNCATRWAEAGSCAVLVASPELPRLVLVDRLCACATGIKLSEIRSGCALDTAHAAKWRAWRDWTTANGALIAIRGRGEDISFAALKDRVSELQDLSGKRVVVVADGLQTLADRFRRPGDGEKDALDRITGEWVDGWGEMDVTSLLLSHMPKGAFTRHEQGVFAGSSRIEYRTDTAIVLQPPKDGERTTPKYPIVAHVTKSWHGPVGRSRLQFDGTCCRFTDGK